MSKSQAKREAVQNPSTPNTSGRDPAARLQAIKDFTIDMMLLIGQHRISSAEFALWISGMVGAAPKGESGEAIFKRFGVSIDPSKGDPDFTPSIVSVELLATLPPP
jgi:hypothetical protein